MDGDPVTVLSLLPMATNGDRPPKLLTPVLVDQKPKVSPADRIKQWRWPKGVSGNPKGRIATGLSLLTIRKEVLASPAPAEVVKNLRHLIPSSWTEPITYGQALELRNIGKALSPKSGDMMAIFICEQLDGKATIRIAGSGEEPIKMQMDYKRLSDDDLHEIIDRLVKAQVDDDTSNTG